MSVEEVPFLRGGSGTDDWRAGTLGLVFVEPGVVCSFRKFKGIHVTFPRNSTVLSAPSLIRSAFDVLTVSATTVLVLATVRFPFYFHFNDGELKETYRIITLIFGFFHPRCASAHFLSWKYRAALNRQIKAI